MALSKAQVEAIKRAQKQAIAKRAATQRTKISDSEARKASSTMNKRAGGSPSYTLRDSNLLSKSELDALGRQSKANAEKERAIQKQRKFAKGEGKLPIKERVGTKAEYKQLGKEIQTRKQLIAYAKAARAAQAERAKNPKAKKAAPAAKATPVEETKPVAKKTTPAKTTAAAPKPKTPKAPATKKKAAAPKAPKAPKTPAVTPTTPETPKSKSTKPKTQKSKTPKAPKAPKLQTLEEAKSKAPTPKGPMEGPAKPIRGPLVDQPRFFPGPQTPKAEAPAKPKGKVATKVAEAKSSAKSSTVARAAKAAAKTPAAKAIAASKTAKVAKVAGKLGGKVLKIGAAVGAVKEVGQIVSGQTEKDFRRIQALENRIAVAKGQKPKYTRTGSNPNLVESLKVDAGNALSFVGLGKSRKARLEELKQTLKKTEAKKPAGKPATKPAAGKAPVITTPGGKKVGGNTPSKVAVGDKYTVKKGDTLSAIASRSGVSLKELRAANPKFTTQAKYKGGNMIFSGTTVAIPKKKAK